MKYSLFAACALMAVAISASAHANNDGTPSNSASHKNEVRELLWSSTGGECTKSCSKAELVGKFHIFTQFDENGNIVYQEVENVNAWGKGKSADKAANGGNDGISALSTVTYQEGDYIVYADQYFITINGETFLRIVYSYYTLDGIYVKSRTADVRRYVYIR
ncbi:hypothetical protein CWE22_00295 [Pseudidiomarina aestuarii]|uniref:Lipocalin-like domain-containing protein n=1 Tax=Pseudidiomarina aestuarii TaxID=624146 RepID=A0A7Z7ETD3_9GAMM|nr:hypothetical protein [Pseudidiomarina aestuarii]RUO40689.1 hypothetical protein CWE22_00295 [Pseudidiomarina aestuarii]